MLKVHVFELQIQSYHFQIFIPSWAHYELVVFRYEDVNLFQDLDHQFIVI